ncbi:MAG TPA: endo alpha-1,4 polygalactosaminidase [Burkholderiaceae bacterium]
MSRKNRNDGLTAHAKPFAVVFATCASMVLLAACGGQSGTSAGAGAQASTPSPTPTPTPASAQWTPTVSTSWEWQLSGTLNLSYAATVYDIDLFNTSAATIAQLQASGHKVVCYFSAGSSENWRPDHSSFTAADMGNAVTGWPGENWLDIRSANVRSIMAARFALAASKGCDGVEPDNVDGYANNSGFPLAAQDQIDYNTYLAGQAHSYRLAVALKNDVGQLAALEPYFDFALNEQCHEYNECAGYSVFTAKNKAVFNAEYASQYVDNTGGARTAMCAAAQAANLRTLVLPLALDGSFRYSCDN